MASATWAVRESSGLEGGAPNCPHGQEKHGAADLGAGVEAPGQFKGKDTLRGGPAHACRRLGRAVESGMAGNARHGGRGAKIRRNIAYATLHRQCRAKSPASALNAVLLKESVVAVAARPSPSSSFIVNSVYMY